MDLALDHVIVAVPDLQIASEALERRHGLRATPGGRHPALGTHNAVVPLGGAYVEIVAVEDERVAATNEFGRAALRARDAPRFMGWVLRTDAIEDAAATWQSDVVPLSRRTPSGREIRWRMVGLEKAGNPERPMIIEWEDLAAAPPSAPPVHPAGTVELEYVEVGDPARVVGTWLPHIDHLRLTASGLPGVHAIALGVGGDKIVITESSFAD